MLSLVVALGVLGTVLAAVALRQASQDRAARALTQQTLIVSHVVSAEIRRYSTSLTDLAGAVGAQSKLEAAEFTAIVAAVDKQRLPGASGVAFVVPAGAGQIAGVQEFWRSLGDPGLTLQPAAAAPGGEHFFIVLSRAVDGGDSGLGRDMAASGAAVEALRMAKDSHQVTTSRTYRLLKDAAVPKEQQQLSFVLAAPIYATSPSAPDAGRFRGWLMMSLRAGDFLRQTIGVVARDTVAVTLFDDAAGTPTPVASWLPNARIQHGHQPRDVAITVPQRTWRLVVEPTDKLLPDADVHLDLAAWIVGAIITTLLAALTRTVLTSRDRALRRVDDATAALRDDIVRREAVEQQLRQRETELVGFAGIVAHDLRSPLARITGYADFLREEAAPRLEPVHRDFLERLYAGAQRMQTLIDDLLNYATAENRTLHTGPVDLFAMAGEIARERSSGTGGDPQPTIIVDPLPTVEGDATLLRQVLENLIGNALKYTPYGQEPYVRIGTAPRPGELGAGELRIEVADRGIGIPVEQRDRVFTAFARAAGSEGYPGTGLGLAIVHRIVERHGGEVGVDANPGGGSRFWFTLPPARGPAATTLVESSPDRKRSPGVRAPSS